MAIPTNPILINQITEVAASLLPEDFLLIDQEGTHKKVQASAFEEVVPLWTQNPDDTIYYLKKIGIGTSSPQESVHVIAEIGPAVKLQSETTNGNTIIITEPGPGNIIQGFELKGGDTGRFSFISQEAGDSFHIDDRTFPQKMTFNASFGGPPIPNRFLTQNLPNSIGSVSGQFYKDGAGNFQQILITP